MKLIKELTESVEFITEEKLGKGKEYYIKGVFLQSNLKNRNGRIYPKEVLQKEIARYNEEYVQKNRAFGELGHPDTPSINLDRVSHMIKELYEDGDNFIGKAKIMDTPMGKIVKNLLDEGATIGVSSRGMGTLRQGKDGVAEVSNDFVLATAADIVADPSAPDAFVEGVMESKEWVFVDGKFVEKDIEEMRQVIKKASSLQLEEAKIKAFQHFLQKIK
jgi:Prohead core protein serine protease